MRRRTALAVPLAAAGLAAVTAGCSSDSTGGGGGGSGGGKLPPLTIHANSTNTYQANFNPFSPSMLHGTRGFVYEPLMLNTPMRPGESMPWLALSQEFNEDGTVVTFTLREGVTWTDGEPFAADDVAYTFNQMVDFPATNANARPVVEAEATGGLTVQVTFEEPQFAFSAAIGNTLIVPEHIWSAIEDPIETTNEEPVGTGPFTLDRFSAQLYTMVKNPQYWQADEMAVEEVHYPANTTETFNTAMGNGDLDWTGGFVPNIEQIFIEHDPENRGYWYPGGGLVTLLYNATKPGFDDVALRSAISLGIDRAQLSEVAMQGYTPAAHPTGLPLPAYESVLADKYTDSTLEFDTAEANRLLDEAGYAAGADGIRVSPDGERMSWNVEVPSSWADWVSIVQLLEEQLVAIGIEIVPQGVAFEAWLETRNNGNFELTLSSVAIGQSPFDMYRSLLSSEYKSEDGGTVTQNFGRYYDDEADAQLAAYAATEDESEKQAALDALQTIVVEELPTIPLLQAPNWFQYNTSRWTGFPTEEEPYAFGAPFQSPDNLLVVMNLEPAE